MDELYKSIPIYLQVWIRALEQKDPKSIQLLSSPNGISALHNGFIDLKDAFHLTPYLESLLSDRGYFCLSIHLLTPHNVPFFDPSSLKDILERNDKDHSEYANHEKMLGRLQNTLAEFEKQSEYRLVL